MRFMNEKFMCWPSCTAHESLRRSPFRFSLPPPPINQKDGSRTQRPSILLFHIPAGLFDNAGMPETPL